MAGKKAVGAGIAVVVMALLASPLIYQQLSKSSLDEQAPPLIESWLMASFPGEYEGGAVKWVNAPRTWDSEVPLPAKVMTKSGTLQQVCITFKRDSLFGEWYAIGECVPAD